MVLDIAEEVDGPVQPAEAISDRATRHTRVVCLLDETEVSAAPASSLR
jgi:hypothetical protein